MPDKHTNLFPFMLAASVGRGRGDCSTIYEMVRAAPELVKMALDHSSSSSSSSSPSSVPSGGSVSNEGRSSFVDNDELSVDLDQKPRAKESLDQKPSANEEKQE